MSEKKKMVSSESLKRVLIRFDFSGSTPSGMEGWINKMKQSELGIFESMNVSECGSFNLDMSNPDKIMESSSISLSSKSRSDLYVFEGGRLEGLKDDIKLEISNFFIALTITCHDYQESGPYRRFVCRVMADLLESDKFIRLTRFGIRKIDIFSFDNLEQLAENITPYAIPHQLIDGGRGFIKNHLEDQYILDNPDNGKFTVLLYHRYLRKVQDGEDFKYQSILDIDCARTDNEIIRPSYEQLVSTSDGLNSRLYEFFVSSLTDYYKDTHEK